MFSLSKAIAIFHFKIPLFKGLKTKIFSKNQLFLLQNSLDNALEFFPSFTHVTSSTILH